MNNERISEGKRTKQGRTATRQHYHRIIMHCNLFAKFKKNCPSCFIYCVVSVLQWVRDREDSGAQVEQALGPIAGERRHEFDSIMEQSKTGTDAKTGGG